jgi:hypothetical protein
MHKQYEELCALAATGQITGEAMAVLDQHIKECEECRKFLQYVVPLKANVAPVVAASHAPNFAPPEGIRERFLQRAAESGLVLNAGPVLSDIEAPRIVPAVRPSRKFFEGWFVPSFRFAVPVAAAILCGVFGYWIALHNPKALIPSAPVVASVRPAATAETSEPVVAQKPVNSESAAQVEALRSQLAAEQKEKRDLMQQLASLSQSAAKGTEFEQQLKSVTMQLQSAEERIAKLNTDIASERANAMSADAILAAQQKVAQDATAKVATLQAKLEGMQGMSMEKGMAGEVIAARNLHIVDVYDSETDGSRRKAFGRVFYIEGKSLVFYAYDLPTRSKDKKLEFKVWGEQAGVRSISISLGAMQNDSSGAGRWLLTCNDPKVLSKINAIYLTREPADGKGSRPKGDKMMYAFLGTPNHP